MLNFLITDQSISIVVDNESYSFSSSYPDFRDLSVACSEQDEDTVKSLIRKFTETLSFLDGKVFSRAGIMYIKTNDGDKSIDSRLHSRISDLHASGNKDDIDGIINLTNKLYKNPNVDSIDDMFRFLAHNSLPITKEGNFIAYKLVREDYKDIYTGTFDNSVGSEPSMPREMCEYDRSVTCSRGLHFCSKEYLPYYGDSNSRIMVLEIDPSDVVSIPIDYNNAKGRACRYKIIGEIPNGVGRDEAIAKVESSVVVKVGNLLASIKTFFKKLGA